MVNQTKIICFIPCCESKYASGSIIKPEQGISSQDLPHTWNNLLNGRKGMEGYIINKSLKTSAINLYIGSPYDTFLPYKNEIVKLIQSGNLQLVIMSPCYGIIDALEPINNYEAELKGKVASYWKNIHLAEIIADLLLQTNPSHVYGFFAGEPSWSTPGSKYRYFFTEGVKAALGNGLNTGLSGCFYRKEGLGIKAILGSLGRIFIDLLKTNFDDSYVQNIYKNGKQDHKVKIGFDKIS